MISISITGKIPSKKNNWKLGNGRIIQYKSEEIGIIKTELAYRWKGAYIEKDPVFVGLSVFQKHKRGDLDNKVTTILDCLQGVAYKNDSQVKHIEARMTYGEKDYFEITVKPLTKPNKKPISLQAYQRRYGQK